MKNEREKEIEHANTAEDFLSKEIRQDSELQSNNNKTQTFQSPGPIERNKKQGEKYMWPHLPIIPVRNMQNGWRGIPYYQQFAEFSLHHK